MGETLRNPPLVEAVCEFRFDAKSDWDWTVPGRLFDRIEAEFSERSELRRLSINVQQAGIQAASPAVIDAGPERVQLKRRDGSAMVQVGPRMLAVNHLRPYANWEAFRKLILDVYRTYRGIAGANGLSRIGLRYINQIAQKGRKPEEILTLRPPLSGKLSRPVANFFQRYELQHDDPNGILIHQSGAQKIEGNTVLTVDLDFVSESVGHLKEEQLVAEWLDAAHDRVEESFIDSLVPKFYETLKRGRK